MASAQKKTGRLYHDFFLPNWYNAIVGFIFFIGCGRKYFIRGNSMLCRYGL